MEITQKAVQQLIREFTGQANTITTPRVFVELTGNHVAAMLLNQIIYWSERTHNNEGWFYKSAKEWDEELGLSSFQVNRALKVLLPLGVETKLKRANNAPTVHYRLNGESFYPLFFKFLENRETRKSRNLKMDIEETSKTDYEETSKTLTEITRDYTESTRSTTANAAPVATAIKKTNPAPKPPPKEYMDNPAVIAYRDRFKITPRVEQRRAIAETVQDFALWQQTLDYWQLNGKKGADPFNVGDMINRYTREVSKAERFKSVPGQRWQKPQPPQKPGCNAMDYLGVDLYGIGTGVKQSV